MNIMGLKRSAQLSARSKMGAKWLSKVKKTSQVRHKDSLTLSVMHLSPLGSQLSFSNVNRIESIVDWDVVRRKYRELRGDLAKLINAGSEKSNNDGTNDQYESEHSPDDSNPSPVGSQATLIATTS